MQSARVNDRVFIAVSIKRGTLKMLSWVLIIDVRDGEGAVAWQGVGADDLECRSWGASTYFFIHFNAFLSKNLDQNMYKKGAKIWKNLRKSEIFLALILTI